MYMSKIKETIKIIYDTMRKEAKHPLKRKHARVKEDAYTNNSIR